MTIRLLIAALLLAAGLLPQWPAWASGAPDASAASMPVQLRRFSFPLFDTQPVMRMRANEGPPGMIFGLRADESATRLTLKFRYTYSPALIPVQSHVRVLLNDEIVGLLPVTREQAGRSQSREIEVDPRLVTTVNKLSLEFVAHYNGECEDPLHLSMWFDVERGTEVLLGTRKKALQSDLAMLPQPFFDLQDYTRLQLPYVFAARPSFATLRAAGIASSWFGKLASWRGARFPANLDTLPKGHAVVFATNAERPSFLAHEKPYAGPSLSVVTNPADGFSKLLLVTGRDGEDLRIAATALVLGLPALSGTRIDITGLRQETPRKAYDAPNWVRLDQPMKFGELMESPQQLQVFGHVPDPIRVNLRIPPDLFTWRSRGVPVNLKFRYTPPIRTADSSLSMSINGERVQSVNLRSTGQGGESARVVLPLLDGGLLGEGRELLIPAFKLGARNQLQYEFSFSYLNAGTCRDMQIENIRAMIDPDSTVDFSGYPHYAEMPHLGYFATSGFPFTKYADLSQTAVVLPPEPGKHDIEVMLGLLGRLSESSGYPATRVTVAGADDSKALQGKDLLLIGAAPAQPLLSTWSKSLPAVITGPGRMIRSVPGRMDTFLQMIGVGTDPSPDPSPQKHVRGNGALAAVLGFESPLEEKRNVVAVTGIEPEDMHAVLDILQDEETVKTMHGSVVLVHGGKAESLFAGRTYSLGSLPFWTTIWFPLSGYPILLAVMSVVAVLVFAFALWRTLRAVAARRLEEGGGE